MGKRLVSNDLLISVFEVFPESDKQNVFDQLERDVEESHSGIFLNENGFEEFDPKKNDVATDSINIPNSEISRLFELRFNSLLTPAETRLLSLLICGKSLKDISEQDGVAYETRRNQMKMLLEKSGAARQSSLIATMSTLVTLHATRTTTGEKQAQKAIKKFLDSFYPGSVRMFSPHLKKGRELLILDVGPLDGQPVIYLHSSFFTIFPFPSQLDVLDRLNVRIIIPIRPGFFDVPFDWSLSPKHRIENFSRSVAEFLHDFGLAAAPILAHAHGSPAAVELCKCLGGKTTRLLLHSAQNAAGEQRKKQPLHIRALTRVIRKSPKTGLLIYKALARSLIRPHKLEETIDKLFSKSAADMVKLQDADDQEWLFALLKDMGGVNIEGIVGDIQQMDLDWYDDLPCLLTPVGILYGSEDPYANYQNLEAEVSENKISIKIVPNEGMLSMLFSPEALLRESVGNL